MKVNIRMRDVTGCSVDVEMIITKKQFEFLKILEKKIDEKADSVAQPDLTITEINKKEVSKNGY